MRKQWFVLLFFVFFSVQSIQSQDTIPSESIDELFNLSLDEILDKVITPSKVPQNAGEVTQKVDIVTRQEIQTSVSGNRNLCEVIAQLPGASVTVLSRNDVNWGTYGGIGPKYSTYMLHGLPVDAFMDPMSLDLNIIDHIEVQRGPASVIYPNYLSQDFAGIQSPLTGTVNLVLKGKIETPVTTFQVAYGSYNTLNGQLMHQNRIGPFSYFCGVTGELSDYTNYGTDPSWLNMKDDPQYTKTKLYGGVTLFLDPMEKQKLTFFFQRTFHAGNAGRVYRRYDNDYGTLNAGYEIMLSEKLYLQSHIGLRTYIREWQESIFGEIDTLKSNNGVDQLIVPADLSLTWAQGTKGILSVGADYQADRYTTWSDPLQGYHSIANQSEISQVGIYAQEEWRPLKGLLIRAGLRYTYLTNKMDLVSGLTPTVSSKTWNHLLWSVGFRYSINKRLGVYANGGSSFAPPGLKSICGTLPASDFKVPGHDGQLPNAGLKPESGIGTDAGFEGTFGHALKTGIRFFYTIVNNAIVENVVSQNPSQTQSINTRSTCYGGEVEISHSINEYLSWFANVTCMISEIRNDSNPDQNNVQIPFSPNVVANCGLAYYAPWGFSVVPSLNYNAGFYDGTSKSSRTWFAPQFLFNAYIAQRIAKGNTYNLEAFVQLYNLTNNCYVMPWQFQNTGFSIMGGLKITFSKKS